MLEFEYNLVGNPINKFFHDQAEFFFWSLGQTSAINKAYIETIYINFNTLNYLTPSYIRVLTWKTMCGSQQLQCKSESAPQIIGAHQPYQINIKVSSFKSRENIRKKSMGQTVQFRILNSLQ